MSKEPLRILMLAANPVDQYRLALKTERELLRNKMADNIAAGTCDLKLEWATRVEDLNVAIRETQPHIVHFSGHGHDESICFEDDERKSRPLSKTELGLLFSQSRNRIRVVVLNACYSARQVEVLQEQVDFIVGTDVPISDGVALQFTNDFYRAVALGSTVREAFKKAQGKAVDQSGQGQYKLLVRLGADETTPLLPPSRSDVIRLTAGTVKVRGEVCMADRIFEGFNPIDLPESSNEATEVIFEPEDLEAGELKIAKDIWKAKRR